MTIPSELLNQVVCMDALELLAMLPDDAVDLIATDPPYNGVKDVEWDNQWKTDADYLDWIKRLLAEFQRVLKPNGSLYLFASPRMAARVEVATGDYFNVLNQIVWNKTNGNANWKADKDVIRSFLPNTERIILAEQYHSDINALGKSGYCEAEMALKRRIWGSPLLIAMQNHSISTHRLTEITGAYGSVNHGGAASNWINGFNVPTSEHYQKIKEFFLSHTGIDYFPREYEDLRREYEDLRRAFNAIRRSFNTSEYRPYTDVWDFRTVNTYEGKHPCEKPYAMMEHIILTSSRPGDVVLDCFAGSGVTGDAASRNGRDYILCDADSHWANYANRRLAMPYTLPMMLEAVQS